ncbi:hypothetical protein ACFWFI_28540 [Streptomyces sp. NPDC060209]|uniref:hypothetical protein n=1 Tax=Streptomyces sp. NPDC060209 TaxID=3347073 RepID=UPI00365A5735
MTSPEGNEKELHQQAEASGNAQVTQVAGDYAEHIHRYVRGWENLRGVHISDAEMDLVEHAFVDSPGPNGSGQAKDGADRLTRAYGRSPVLVVCAEAGAGRRTSALRVLRDAGVPRKRILWLLLDWDRPRTEQIPFTEGHGFVLDLTGYRTLAEDFYTGLTDYQKEAEAHSAFLIILADPSAWRPGTLTAVPALPVVRPPAPQVAEAHLQYLAPGRAHWLNSAPLDTLLAAGASAAEAARLARLIAQAKDDGKMAVKEEFSDWKDHLQHWFDEHSADKDLRERALLVAAALLEKVPADVVLDAADRLFSEVGGKLPPGGALAGLDLEQRLNAIDARQVDDEGLSLEAEQHGMPAAVLKYVWQQRPQLRPVLLEWASQISAPDGIAAGYLRRIADCLVQLSLLPGGSTVRSVASDWIGTGRSTHQQLAIEILETMALHPVTGVAVRKQLYDWAHQKTTSPEMIKAVGKICAGQLGQKYPRVALTRLRLLAARGDDVSLKAATDAMRILATDPGQHLLVLSEIVGWAESTDSTVRSAGARTFLALADTSEALLLPSGTGAGDGLSSTLAGELCIRGWQVLLQESATAEAAHIRLAAWLDSPELPDEEILPLATAVLRGCAGQVGPAALLVGSSSSSDLGRSRRRRLLDEILTDHTASPTEDWPPAHPAGETSSAPA